MSLSEKSETSGGTDDLASLLSRIAGTPRRGGPWPSTADLLRLARSEPLELGRDLALGPAAARRLAAAFELGRRMEELRMGPRPMLGTPGAVHRLLAPRARGLDRETFWCLLLDGRHRLMRTWVVSVGTLTCSLVHPREVFGKAVALGAAAIVVAHNHPSGDPEPSAEDREVTRRLFAAGELLGIPLVDHVVLGLNGFRSLREEPFWPRGSKT